MGIDPTKIWAMLEARLAVEPDPICRRNLELVIAHGKAEARADIDGVLATLSETPRYRTHGTGDDARLNPSGSKDAVRAFYETTIVATGAHRLEHDVDRVIVDHGAVFTEGRMRMAYPGTALVAMGIDVDDADAHYLFEARMAIVWPVDPDDGRLVGEEVYTVGDGFAGIAQRKIDLADVVELPVEVD